MDKFISTGEFASKAGVTIRTLRYYDKIGLLKPSKLNDKGHRLYCMDDFIRLQKILTLKFIGLSLQDIKRIMIYEGNDDDLRYSLELQKKVIENRVAQLNMVTKAIDEMIENIPLNDKPHWDEMFSIMNIVNKHTKWLEQYENATNLRKRISIHDKFSKNKEGWMPWFFNELLNITDSYPKDKEIKILELGCGDGSLWAKNIHLMKNNFNITLTDFSPGMLEDAKKNLKDYTNNFNFKLVDALEIPFEESTYDIVIANHMLYHLTNLDKALLNIKNILKPNGYFFASTVGENHMKELSNIINGVNCKSLKWEGIINTRNFNLESGKNILSKHFKNIYLKRYEDALIINKALPLTHYILSMPENIKNNLDEKIYTKLVNYIESIIDKNKNIIITKDTGYFRCNK
ncbi:MerR family transcriptional regulator [Hathewaya limosa]|uniref:DNA-binding transcriptional MerR regulator/ubiquinone/menaquinone biosynthesis C-methylase UbiE n=1 Tax=Hathewaya limosa TaxID=1536 RepID=A0ABU0JQB2_HATLI|nr:MerR family transcriptional regulator [Hathewaya limosa]MDQ0479285.1 DNA-binding transcriptional MerR regulator/ubiquinone/menaquinone biosynthesis C-methylase UbiE [Hathewaya limosa]